MFSFQIGSLGGAKRPMMPGMGPGLLANGVLCILIGIAVLVAPELLAYFIASILIFFGISLVAMWWKISRHSKFR